MCLHTNKIPTLIRAHIGAPYSRIVISYCVGIEATTLAQVRRAPRSHEPKMLTLDPNSDKLPKRSELPQIPGAPAGAFRFWGKDDEVSRNKGCSFCHRLWTYLSRSQLGRLNMLTPQRTAAAAALIKTGEVVSLK